MLKSVVRQASQTAARPLSFSESNSLSPRARIQDEPLAVDLVHPHRDMIPRPVPLQLLDARLRGFRVPGRIGVLQLDPELAAGTLCPRVLKLPISLPQA